MEAVEAKQVAQQEAERARFLVEKVPTIDLKGCDHRSSSSWGRTWARWVTP